MRLLPARARLAGWSRNSNVTFCVWFKVVEALVTEANAITGFILYCKLCFHLFGCNEKLIIHFLMRYPDHICVACWYKLILQLIGMLCLHPSGGNKVDLSGATVTFTKGVLGYLADGLSVNTPQVKHSACYTTDLYSFLRKLSAKRRISLSISP